MVPSRRRCEEGRKRKCNGEVSALNKDERGRQSTPLTPQLGRRWRLLESQHATR